MKIIAALIGFAAIALFQSAIVLAQTVSRDENNNVFISGLAPGIFAKVTYGNAPLEKSFTPNSCGVITIKSTSKEPFIFFSYPGSEMIDWNELPVTEGKPLCKNGIPNPDIAWNSLGARSSSDPSQPRISYIRSNIPLLITSRNNFKERLVKSNACGIISLRSTPTWSFEKLGTFYFTLSGSNPSDEFVSTSLPVVPRPLCYRGRLYLPL